jgi:glycosyltransferase involved in cell wall biosynthesis
MPRVSIITAAYNRSNVLRYAIESVQRQTFRELEHIIVGDHCTDDTEAVVAAFDDPRIRFVNLPENSGGQSAPHNHGLTMARGDIILYLNQDDIYFPDHVASSVAFLEETGADLIWGPVVYPTTENRTALDWREQPILLRGVSAEGRYDPEMFIVSSCWALRRAAAERLGPWKPASETPLSPSQEFIRRAWTSGCDLKFHRHVSVLCIFSGHRRNSYASRDFAEHERYFHLLFDEPDGFARIMEHVAITLESMHRRPLAQDIPTALRIVPKLLIRRALTATGVDPKALIRQARNRIRGMLVARHRSYVLEPPVVKKGDLIRMGERAANPFLGFGWSKREGTHRWTENRLGQMAFRLDPSARPEKLLIRGRPIVPQVVEFQVDGRNVLTLDYSDGREIAEVPLAGARDIVSLTVAVSQAARPRDLGGGGDSRLLGFRASEIEFL